MKSIVLNIVSLNCYDITNPPNKKYAIFRYGRLWPEELLPIFGIDGYVGKVKFSVSQTKFKNAKLLRIIKKSLCSDHNTLGKIEKTIVYLPCQPALNIFFNKQIPKQCYLRIDIVK